MSTKLTEQAARAVMPPPTGQKIIWDATLHGFGLRVTANGAKAFVLDYRHAGRQRRMTIGAFPDWTVAEAREQAKNLKRDINLGRDPMAERHAEREAPTILDLWQRYEAEHLPSKAMRSQADERSMWTKLILPRLGKIQVVAVSHSDVDSLHRYVTTIRGTPTRANRVVASLRKALNLAIRWGWSGTNPASGVRLNGEQPRARYLDKQEINSLARALAEHPQRTSACVIAFLLLTGARRGEALGATWNQFDLENEIWTKPSSHTKQRRTHRVPLSHAAAQLLREIQASAEKRAMREGTPLNQFLFPGPDGRPLVDIKRTWSAVCEKAGLVERVEKRRGGKIVKGKNGQPIMIWKPTARLHDLRHTYASLLITGGATLPTVGALLGHSQPATTARYAHLHDGALREATEMVGAVVQPAAEARDITPRREDPDADA